MLMFGATMCVLGKQWIILQAQADLTIFMLSDAYDYHTCSEYGETAVHQVVGK